MSCTTTKRPISATATVSQASRVLTSAHSDDFPFSVSFCQLFPTAVPHCMCMVASPHHLKATSHICITSDLLQNLSEGSFLLPLTLDPFLPFPRGIFEDLFTSALLRAKYSHIPRINCSFPITFQILPRCAFPFPPLLSIATISSAACPAAVFDVALLTQIYCGLLSTFFSQHRCNLPVPDRFFTDSIVAVINGSSWFAEGTRHQGYFHCFFFGNCQCLTNEVLCF